MWLSRQMKAPAPTADADLGMTTITGDSVGVVTRGEVRALPVYGPGGYVWMPESGAAVLVIKGGPGGEEQCVAGQQQALIPEGMGPGEVYLFSPGGDSCDSCPPPDGRARLNNIWRRPWRRNRG